MKKILLFTLFLAYALVANASTKMSAYRWRNDDGNETTATWKAAVNTPITHSSSNKLRLRVAIDEITSGFSGTTAANAIISYSENGGPWINITASSSAFVLVSSNFVTDGVNTTQQIATGNSSNFVGGLFKSTEANTGFSIPVGTSKFCEHEFCIQPTAAYVSTNTYTFKADGINTSNANEYPTINAIPAGASLSFDGSNDFVKVNDNPLLDFGSNDFTVEYWVYKKNANVYGGVSKWNTRLSPTTNEWGLLLNADGAGSNRPNFIIESGSTSYDCPGSTNLNLNTWYHLAGVRQGTNLKIYVNGILENTVPIGNITVNNSGRDLLIDRLLSGYFGGAIYDEIRIWNRALSACEIQYNKDAELANGQSGLIAYFKCNQGIANSNNSGIIDLIDETPNGFEGEITNFQLNGSTSNFVSPGSPASSVSGTLYNLLSVNSTQDFCYAAEVSDLVATGTGTINWYNVSTGGTPLNDTQNLTSGTYYVSQTTGTCESERKAVTVTVTILAAPTANANQTYEANATVANLVATGSNLKWYALASGGTELTPATPLSTTTYYVSQSNNGCESERTAVNVTVNGGSLHFDDTDDRVVLNTAINSVLDPINTFSVESWVYNTAFNNGLGNNVGMIVGNYNTSAVDMQFMLRREGTSYQFWVNDSNTTAFKAVTATNVAVLNQWQHVAGVWNGSDLKIYINGNLVATTTGVTGASFKSQLTNSIQLGTNLSNEKFVGNIDEVRLWTKALTATEIMNNMNCELSASTTNLLAYYKFNQGVANANNSGVNTLTDSSGNNYNGALNNFALNGTISNWSNIAAVATGNTCSPALSNEDFNKLSVSFYPNPTSDVLHISNNREITEVMVYNLLGQTVLNQKYNATEVSINLSTLPTNTYLVKVVCGDESDTIKVMKK